MNEKNLNEAFVGSLGKNLNNKPIFFIDQSKPENANSFQYKDILKKYGAQWSQSPRHARSFPADFKAWFWYVGDTEDQKRNVFAKFIQPALKEIHKLEGASGEESEGAIVSSIDALVGEVEDVDRSNVGGGTKMTETDIDEVKQKLLDFKEMLVNIESDEDYKNAMRALVAFKNVQGHQYSWKNTILIFIQNRNAKMVMSPIRWLKYNRTVKPDATPILVLSPSKGAIMPWSKDQKEKVTQSFLQKLGKKSVNELSVGERDELGIALRGRVVRKQFDYTEAYDVADTIQIEGKEDFVTDIEAKEKLKWYEDDMTDSAVTPIYQSMEDLANSLGIKIKYVNADSLGGARGSSAGGTVTMPENARNDVGLTKTLAHELLHEILHQSYGKDRNPDLKQYFLGTSEGRAVVEQQAELGAWMLMSVYGFDLKTTSINYTVIWGAKKESMIDVYEKVEKAVNYMIYQINERLPKYQTEVNEATGGTITPASPITALDVARANGHEQEYREALQQQQRLNEFVNRYKKLIK